MNIKQAKEQIMNAMRAYFTKDEYGNFCIPIHEQRPVFLMGPPGIGKTAIMAQIAAELDVGLVPYSMTHHTRQSALGLPFIETKIYGDKEYRVSEYTMSEIIASVYDMIEETGKKEGILFLDEINCVSETLSPAMLQFLQYKIFGKHTVPDGWIVVTAGNPLEYNKSAREFDMVTWDRLKRIDVEPDFIVWKEYAYKKGIHASIITFLEIKKSYFFKIETTVDGKHFVTPRGWSDLSDMIVLYEKNGITVDDKLINQYLHSPAIAKEFAIYYDLFNKYKSDYQIDKILGGAVDSEIKTRANRGSFDERISLLGLIMDAITAEIRQVCDKEMAQAELLAMLRKVKPQLDKNTDSPEQLLRGYIDELVKGISVAEKAGSLSKDAKNAKLGAKVAIEDMIAHLFKKQPKDNNAAFLALKAEFDRHGKDIKALAAKVNDRLSNVFLFCSEVFGDNQEMVILLAELTSNYYASRFIARYNNEEYFKNNKNLLFFERQKQILADIDSIEWDKED